MALEPQPGRVEGLALDLGIDPRTAWRTLARVVGLALRHRVRFAVATGAGLLATLFNLAVPRLLGHAVDQAQALLKRGAAEPQAALRALGVTALVLLAASAARGVAQMVSSFHGETLGQQVARDLRLAYFDKLQQLGFDFHDRIHSGELITRGMLDLEGVRGFIEMGMQRIIAMLLLVVIGGAALATQDPVMALVTLSFIPFAVWRAGRMGLLLRLAWTRLQRQMAVVTRVMEENLQGVRVVRAFGSEPYEMGKFDAAAKVALALSNARLRYRANSLATISSSYYLAMALALAVGAYRISHGAISIGQLTECLAFMTILQMPVRQISMVMNSGARAMSSGRRVFEVLDFEPAIRDASGATALERPVGVLRFDHVSFAYPGAKDAPVLRDVSFTVEPGRTLAIVGPSGSGKSSIAQLIPRFYDVDAGRITLDGRDIRTLTLASLRQAVSVVAQDVFLFDDSIERNIAYAAPDAGRRELKEAARIAHIHDHAESLEAGYETSVGERGAGLSGGQRQRVSIARGLMTRARVLVFDDATSAVDAATEHGLRHALADATSAHATLIISHRLSSLMHADEILVLQDGRITERGDHASLVAAGGYYAALYAMQTEAGERAPANGERLFA